LSNSLSIKVFKIFYAFDIAIKQKEMLNQRKEDQIRMEVGSRIQELRKLNKITAKELAEQIDVSPSFISAIEHNSTKLSLKTLNHICEVLGVTLAEFFNTEMSPVEKKLTAQIKKMPEEKKYELLAFLTGLIS
jgi:transcriptional regulator with XRE-family HTH domain